MKIQGVKGANDILPPAVKEWQALEAKARELFELYGFREIRTPVFEHTDLFVRSVGEGTDIVTKEMYSFEDKGEKWLTLRPEATACVVRAYLEHGYPAQDPLQKFYYIGPMFRRERPQAGRYRQFHQLGVEVLGSREAAQDAEAITLAHRFFNDIGLPEIKILVNNVGCSACRATYIESLKKYLKPLLPQLCESCHVRFEKNVLRVLDCKSPECKKVIEKAPSILESNCEECRKHFAKVEECLAATKVAYEVAPRLVRGLDYYTRTVFEISHPLLGAQDAIGAGGRYDNLIGDLGGPKQLGATGFAFGVERILLALANKQASLNVPAGPAVYLVSLGEEAFRMNFKLLFELREKGVAAEMDLEGKSVKAQMRQADKSGATYALVRGDDEIQKKEVKLKNLKHGTEKVVLQDQVWNFLELRK